MLVDVDSPRGQAALVARAAETLDAVPIRRRAEAWASVAGEMASLSRDEIASLARGAGLSEEGVRWALEATFADVTAEGLFDAMSRTFEQVHAAGARPVPRGPVGVVLAANVFTAGFRALALPMLAGCPVLAKVSRRSAGLESRMAAALGRACPEMAPALRLITLGDSPDQLEAALSESVVVDVYGHDTSVRAVRSSAPPATMVVPHGAGLGVGFVGRRADVGAAADAFADDVAAYDQRGCLSPAAILVEGESGPFADALFTALERLARERPRGALDQGAAAAQMQWRGVALAKGALREGSAFAVSREEGAIRLSPGGRNIAVVTVEDAGAARAELAKLGGRLKALGVAGMEPARAMAMVPPASSPRLTPAGQMQRPPFDTPWDGIAFGQPYVAQIGG